MNILTLTHSTSKYLSNSVLEMFILSLEKVIGLINIISSLINFHFRGCLKCMIIYEKHYNVLQYREGEYKDYCKDEMDEIIVTKSRPRLCLQSFK